MPRLNDLFQTPAGCLPPAASGQPYVIAEVGVNHEGDLDLAKRLVAEAAKGGADAVKFQTYKADTIACKASPAYWDTTQEPTQSQHELFRKYDAFWQEEYAALAEVCRQEGVEFLSTPFDFASVDFLDALMPAYKIASADITNKPFIQRIAAKKKPILLSTGASHLYEIEQALAWIRPFGNPVALLHCVLNYPTPDAGAHLGMITHLAARFPEAVIGYSDHTLPGERMKPLELAHLLGARILEKHFTHDKTLPGNDHYHAMDHRDLAAFRVLVERNLTLCGRFAKAPLEAEAPARKHARRSLVTLRALKAGEVVTEEVLCAKRPAHGISPALVDQVVGMAARADIPEDTALTWGMLDDVNR